jgi:eukaryotic-like serine/threonine-protein kinase
VSGRSAEARAEGRAGKPQPLPAGKVVGERYAIEEVIGEGAHGVVYAARRMADSGERVALKVLHRHLCGDEQVKKRFLREADILKRLDGEHVAKLLDFVDEDGQLSIALELVEGGSLEALLGLEAPLPVKLALEITLQVCAALGVAHAAGVVHRDLKPANVLLERRAGESGVPLVRVVDFGLAKVIHGQAEATGLTEQDMIFGTPQYMSPEQALGEETDERTDLYAAGVMLYEMVVGTVPFNGPTVMAALSAHLTQEPPPPRVARPDRSISPTLEAVILRALSKERQGRYASARAFAEALVSAAEESLIVVPSPIADAASIAEGDTDLNIGEAVTLVPASSEPPLSPFVPPAREVAVAAIDAEAAPRALTEPPHAPRSRWLWALVAVVAAVVGVAIGAIVGMR